MKDQATKRTRDEVIPPRYELGTWLRSLRSFFEPSNHPYSKSERADVLSRDFKCETGVVREVLLRCLQLVVSITPGDSPPRFYTNKAAADAPAAFAETVKPPGGVADSVEGLADLSEALKNACVLADAMLEAPSVKFAGWTGLGETLRRELSRSEAAALLVEGSNRFAESGLHEALSSLARGVASDELGEDLLTIFKGFTRLLGRLALAETMLREDAQLKQLLALFTLVREESGELLDFIENRALRADGLEAKTRELLDSTAYAVRMELRKAFEHELAGFCALRQPTLVFAKAENACGLLRDCFRQSVVALAQGFDPALEGGGLFAEFETKLEQSLALRQDLWKLVSFLRRAVGDGQPPSADSVRERLNVFKEGSQRFLMYKDWEPFERFVEEVEDSRGPDPLSQVLHRFEAFLETLFGQVNMRAVLAHHPFEPPTD